MKTKHIFAAAPLALALFAGAASAQASILDANLNVGTDATVNTGATNVKANTSVKATTNASTSGMSSAGVAAGTKDAATTTSNIKESTSAELDAYVQTIAATNADVKDVDTTSDDKVVVEFKRPAKLFGFIDVDLTEKAVVKSDDGKLEASVSKSWWSIFASDDAKTDEFSQTLKARVEHSGAATMSEELTASEKAELIAEINAAAQATYSAKANADAGAGADARSY